MCFLKYFKRSDVITVKVQTGQTVEVTNLTLKLQKITSWAEELYSEFSCSISPLETTMTIFYENRIKGKYLEVLKSNNNKILFKETGVYSFNLYFGDFRSLEYIPPISPVGLEIPQVPFKFIIYIDDKIYKEFYYSLTNTLCGSFPSVNINERFTIDIFECSILQIYVEFTSAVNFGMSIPVSNFDIIKIC